MSLEFRVISDCHFEFHRKEFVYDRLGRMPRDDERVLVIAGDFCQLTYGDNVVDLIRELSTRFKAIVWVPGNHEYYGFRIKPDSVKRYFIKKVNPDNLPNVHFLIRESVVIDGVRFVGATLWTDLDKGNPIVRHLIWDKMNDFKKITYHNARFDTYRTFRPADWLEEHIKDFNFIKSEVAESAEPCVVVTHHAPCALSLDPAYENDTYGNFGYHSDLSEFILDNPKITNWCHGHIHYANHYKVGDTQVICNPYGYPGEDVEYFDRVFYNAY